MVTDEDFVIGNKFKFKCSNEELIYIGCNTRGGQWFELAKVEEPNIVWSEVCSNDFKLLERI